MESNKNSGSGENPGDDVEQAILQLIRERGGMTLAGNREYYAELKYRDGQWLRIDGDPMTREESILECGETFALGYIRGRVRDLMGVHGPDRGEVSSAEVLAWLQGQRAAGGQG